MTRELYESKLDDLITRVFAAPTGPQVAACFDYDGTVISGFSASVFYAERIKACKVSPRELANALQALATGIQSEEEFTHALEDMLQAQKGARVADLVEEGERLFKHATAARLHHEVWELVEAHHAMGHTVVLASSATRFQVEPMARDLDASHVLCTPVETDGEAITGRIGGPVVWGLGKAHALRALAADRGLDLSASFGYSNGCEDIPFLKSVANPVAVEPDEDLRAVAARQDWPVLRCKPRGGREVSSILRTAGFYGGFAAAFAAGIGVGLMNKSRQQLVDITGEVGSDVGLALAGVDVRVISGAEYLWLSRPCVFIFNHQSKIDPIVVMKLLRSGFTGVAKKEAKNVPGFGQLFQLAGAAFVDRGNTAQAQEALAPAVAKVCDEGMSIAMAPEGTRSATPRLGIFKKGAFHIAMQAEVPIVPIVLRGAGEAMWRGAQTIHGGIVEAVVHPPIDTSGWQPDDVGRHALETRELFETTLARWPGRPEPPPVNRDTNPRALSSAKRSYPSTENGEL